MKIDSINSNQSFGTLAISRRAETLLKERIKRPSDFAKLERLAESQSNNSVNVTISAYDTCSVNYPDVFVAFIDYVKQGESRRKYLIDNSTGTSSPLKFIRRACNKADKMARKLAKSEKTN